VHSGEVDTPKQVEKYKFLAAMQARMAELIGDQTKESAHARLAAVVGDLNVGHTELDVKTWKGNIKNAGFLPEERAYFDTFMHQQGWRDLGRDAHPGLLAPTPGGLLEAKLSTPMRGGALIRIGNPGASPSC
jgi:exodeoxyribonuclease-3